MFAVLTEPNPNSPFANFCNTCPVLAPDPPFTSVKFTSSVTPEGNVVACHLLLPAFQIRAWLFVGVP